MNAATISLKYDATEIVARRIAATIIDIIPLVYSEKLFRLITNDRYGYKINSIAWLIIIALYYLILECLTGYTIGKFILRIKVVDKRCKPPSFSKGIIRTFFRIIEVNPILFYAPSFYTAVNGKFKQRLGDLAAKTYVIKIKDCKMVNTSNYTENELDKNEIITEGETLSLYGFDIKISKFGSLQVYGIEEMSKSDVLYEISKGAKFVIFQYCLSAVLIESHKTSPIFFIRYGEHTSKHSFFYTLITFIFGWWSVPGFIATPMIIFRNIKGGIDVTEEVKEVLFYI